MVDDDDDDDDDDLLSQNLVLVMCLSHVGQNNKIDIAMFSISFTMFLKVFTIFFICFTEYDPNKIMSINSLCLKK